MFNIGTGELLGIARVALMALGAVELPRAALTVGQFTAEARKIANGFRHEMQQAMDEVAQPAEPRDDRDPAHRLSAPPADARPIDTSAVEQPTTARPEAPARPTPPTPASSSNGSGDGSG